MGFLVVRGFSSDRKVMLDSDLGSLLSTPPFARHWRWAAMARVAKSEIRRWRSLSSKLPMLLRPPPWFERLIDGCKEKK